MDIRVSKIGNKVSERYPDTPLAESLHYTNKSNTPFTNSIMRIFTLFGPKKGPGAE